MKTNIKKSLKLLTLLITSLLIATASAYTYTYLFMGVGITVTSQQIVWIKDGSIVPGGTVNMTFTVQQGVYTWFNETLYLKNTGATTNVNITVTDPASTSVFDTCNVYVYENSTVPGTWTTVGTLDALTSASLLNKSLNSYFRFDFEIKAKSDAVPGNYGFEITVAY
ncbi:MAG: hypothetical protein ACP5LB_04715 [Candidatus Bathyarchaeia archaeon]